jgi:hypothetical protein
MTDPTARLAARIRRDFPEPGSAEVIIESLRDVDAGERVQTAIVLWARSDLSRFRDSLALAHVDWRDVLVRGGLENDDWHQVLDAALDD